MHCPNCEYVLWNLKTRVCPECGERFKPSEFTFVPSSVQFVCPDCDQQYYGTDRTGHLIPRAFDCVRCGRHLEMDAMVLRPHDPKIRTVVDHASMPWLERRTRGRLRCWFAMIGRSMQRPKELLLATPVQSSVMESWWYAILTTSIYHLAAWSLPCCLVGGLSSGTTSAGPGSLEFAARQMATALAWPLGLTLASLMVLLLSGLTAHLILRRIASPQAGLGRTFHALCYASGANALSAIPCLGFLIGWIWWMVSGGIALAAAQKVDQGRAMLATIALPLAIFLIFIGWVIVAMLIEM